MTPSLGCVALVFLSPVQETYVCVTGRVIVCAHDQTYLLCHACHGAAASAPLSSLVLAVEKGFFAFSLTEASQMLAFCISQFRVSIRNCQTGMAATRHLRPAEGDEEDEVSLDELESELLPELVLELEGGLPLLRQHHIKSSSQGDPTRLPECAITSPQNQPPCNHTFYGSVARKRTPGCNLRSSIHERMARKNLTATTGTMQHTFRSKRRQGQLAEMEPNKAST